MEQIGNLIEQGKMGLISQKTSNETTRKGSLERGIKLFKYLCTLFPLYGSQNNTKEKVRGEHFKWAEAVETLTDIEVRRACKHIRDNEQYCPIVARFKFKAKGLVDSDRAWEERSAIHDCSALRQAFIGVNDFSGRRMSEEQQRRRFKALYTANCEKVMSGKWHETPIAVALERQEPEVEEQLPKDEQLKVAEAAIAKINRILNK